MPTKIIQKAVFILFFALPLWGQETFKTFKNPSYKGAPVLAGAVKDIEDFVLTRANSLCRVAGYTGYATTLNIEKFKKEKKIKTKLVVKEKTRVFLPESLFNKRELEFLYLDPFPTDQLIELNEGSSSFYTSSNGVHNCTVAAACREWDVFNDNILFEATWTEHPFTQKCHNWIIKEEKDVYVFSEVTCYGKLFESNLIEEKTYELATKVSEEQCQSKPVVKLAQGSTKAPKVGECQYNNWGPQRNLGASPLIGESLFMFSLLSGRISLDPKKGPECVKNILTEYASIALKPEYGLSNPGRLKQAFCVDIVSNPTFDNGQCKFQVSGHDFLQQPFTIEIVKGVSSLNGSKTYDQTHLQEDCKLTKKCWDSEELSCKSANFCPAPGVL